VRELSTELLAAQEEAAALAGAHELMLSNSPSAEQLAAAAVARERAQQEARNREVLELLKSKVGARGAAAHALCSHQAGGAAGSTTAVALWSLHG
jgi:hypothetical protein